MRPIKAQRLLPLPTHVSVLLSKLSTMKYPSQGQLLGSPDLGHGYIAGPAECNIKSDSPALSRDSHTVGTPKYL